MKSNSKRKDDNAVYLDRRLNHIESRLQALERVTKTALAGITIKEFKQLEKILMELLDPKSKL